MARVTVVVSARKDQKPCHKCGKEIKAGDSYKWFASRLGSYSIRKNFCSTCQIRPSDQTTSPNLQTLYSYTESAEDQIDNAESLAELSEILSSCAEGVREVQEMYDESANNMEDGFGHETYQSQEIREKAEMLESFADELESAASDIEGTDDPDEEAESIAEDLGIDPDEDEDYEEQIEQVREDRRQAAKDSAYDALGNCPL